MVNYQKLFVDISRGYSITKHRNQIVYIKHFSAEQQLIIDSDFNSFLENAVNKGLPKKEDVVKRLIKDGFWSEEDSDNINKWKTEIDALSERKRNQILQSKIKEIDKKIGELKLEIIKKENELNNLVGVCAEFDANQRINETYIRLGFFKDPKFECQLINKENIDWLDSDDITELINLYNGETANFSDDAIKKLAIQDFFLNYFFLTNDVCSFYGRPIYQLTFFQLRLATYGRYFKNIYENNDLSKVPHDIKNDPDKLIDYINTRKNMDEVIDKSENMRAGDNGRETIMKSTAIIGATKEDIEHLNQDGPAGPDPFEAARKNGGSLDLNSYIKLMAGR